MVFSCVASSLARLHDEARPFLVMTNGGGMFEHEKADELSRLLHVPIDPDQVILSHTPMKELAKKYSNEPVVIIGERSSSKVAHHYGFQKAMSMSEYWRLRPEMLANAGFDKLVPLRDDFEPAFDPTHDRVAALMSFSDSVFWKQDIQGAIDLVLTNGQPWSTTRHDHSHPSHSHPQLPMYTSNSDFEYPDIFHHPRFAQGAFLDCLSTLYSRLCGRKLTYTPYGKPTRATFDFAYNLLLSRLPLSPFSSISRIFMVGDNPYADIVGANQAGDPWVSVLVRTGMFKGAGNHDQHPAHHVVDDVGNAVDLAFLGGVERESG